MTTPSSPPPGSPHASGDGATVIPATPADLDTLAQVIADAFHGLPPSVWLIPDPATRREILPAYFRLLAGHALATGVVHTTPGRTAAALWLPAGVNGPGEIPGYSQRLPAIAGPWTSHFLAFDAALAHRHPTGTPHHHLAILAVHPRRQGQGIGTALLRTHHRALDRQHLPAYLEAADLRSRQLYLTHGYTDQGAVIHLPDGPHMYPLWRAPRGRGGRK